jgi:hypothetical protein
MKRLRMIWGWLYSPVGGDLRTITAVAVTVMACMVVAKLCLNHPRHTAPPQPLRDTTWIEVFRTVKTERELFTEALAWVESRHDTKAVNGIHVGRFQLSPEWVKIANEYRIRKKLGLFTDADRFDFEKSQMIFDEVNNKLNPAFDLNEVIRLHNPTAGKGYKLAIMRKFNELKAEQDSLLKKQQRLWVQD